MNKDDIYINKSDQIKKDSGLRNNELTKILADIDEIIEKLIASYPELSAAEKNNSDISDPFKLRCRLTAMQMRATQELTRVARKRLSELSPN